MATAVLLVPGFAASELHQFEPDGIRTSKLWLSYPKTLWGGIENLKLDLGGEGRAAPIVVAPNALHSVYQPFIRYCQFLGLTYFEFAYDWRRDVATNGVELAKYLQRFRNSGFEITIVGHSMGGLVAASALQRIDADLVRTFPRLVTMGTPWRGSYQSVLMLTGQHQISQWVASFNQWGTFSSYREWRRRHGRVAASWPGIYDLLPWPEMLASDGQLPDSDPWALAWWDGVNSDISELELLSAPLRTPARSPLPAGVTHHNWRGLWEETPGPMPKKLPGERWSNFKALDGDGTVPAFSSLPPEGWPSLGQNFLAKHDQFTNDPSVQVQLRTLLGL